MEEMKSFEEIKETNCLYKNDYECRITHSGCLDIVGLGLGGTKLRCLEKFADCLKKFHCEELPMYKQAVDVLNNPEKYKEELKTVLRNVNEVDQEASEEIKKEKENKTEEILTEMEKEAEFKEIKEEVLEEVNKESKKEL